MSDLFRHWERVFMLRTFHSDLAEFLEDLGHVLEWSAVGRFIREPDLEKIVQRAKGTMSNLERRYDVSVCFVVKSTWGS